MCMLYIVLLYTHFVEACIKVFREGVHIISTYKKVIRSIKGCSDGQAFIRLSVQQTITVCYLSMVAQQQHG